MFTDPEVLSRLADPSPEAMELSAALFRWYFSAARPENADAAAQAGKDGVDVILAAMTRVAACS